MAKIRKRLTIFLLLLTPLLCQADDSKGYQKRFAYSGDGHIWMHGEKSGQDFDGQYRHPSGDYDEQAYKSICVVYGAPYDGFHSGLSLRLIEFLDYLEDRLAPKALITITSGYRSPSYNKHLRDSGALAAKASLHQYGMAADLKMDGVSAKKIWQYVKKLGFGGTGYYQGETVHLDVGPARFWDEKTSGVGTDISNDNKLIGLVTEYDLYYPGETVTMRFIRMTAFPIGVSATFHLSPGPAITMAEKGAFIPSFGVASDDVCIRCENIKQMSGILWKLPQKTPSGSYSIQADFCQNSWDAMPKGIMTPVFHVVQPQKMGSR